MSNKIFALVGPYAAGKATLVQKLIDLGIHYIPVYTTCEAGKLKKDTDVIKYLSKASFNQHDWMVKAAYKGSFYGIKKHDLLTAVNNNKISVTILDLNGFKQISNLLTGHLFTVYLMADYVSLVDRMLRLGLNNAEMKHHLEYAESNNEFNFWKTADFIIKNVHAIDIAFNQLMAIMGLSVNAPEQVIRQLNEMK